jgi:hypothetical protein
MIKFQNKDGTIVMTMEDDEQTPRVLVDFKHKKRAAKEDEEEVQAEETEEDCPHG